MPKIMIIDDSENVRGQLRSLLESKGHTVVECEDGLDALAKIKNHSDIKLIFCDVNMPKMGGLEFCEEIHKDPSTGSIPIVMITSEGNSKYKEKGKANGVIAWIIKPFSEANVVLATDTILKKYK